VNSASSNPFTEQSDKTSAYSLFDGTVDTCGLPDPPRPKFHAQWAFKGDEMLVTDLSGRVESLETFFLVVMRGLHFLASGDLATEVDNESTP